MRTLSAQAVAGAQAAHMVPTAGGYGGPQPGGGPQNTSNAEGTCQGDEGLGLDRLSGPRLAARRHRHALDHVAASSCRPARDSIPSNSRIEALARSGNGQYITDMTVSGTPSSGCWSRAIGNAGALAVALPLKDVNHTLSSQLTLLVVIAAAGIALAALLGFLVARTALAPIERFTRRTEAIAGRRADRPAPGGEGRDEIARLARTLNRTLDELEMSVAAQRQLVADASHELRTPIATIRANLAGDAR